MQGFDTDLAAILEGVTDAFFTLDGEWRFTYLNREAGRLLAPGTECALGRDLREVAPAAVGEPLIRELSRAVETKDTVEFLQHHPPTDARLWVRAYPLENGLAVSFREVGGEVVESNAPTLPAEPAKATEEKHEASQENDGPEWLGLMGRALDASSAGAIITDFTRPGNPVVYANRAILRMTGYSEEEMLGHNCRFLQGGDRDQPELANLREAVERGREWTGTLRNYRKDDSLFYNELYLSPVHSEAGHVTHYVGIQNDVTARIKAEQERRESEQRLRSVLTRYGSEMVTILDPDGNPRYESPAIRQTLGYSHLEEYGDALYERLHPDDAPVMAQAIGVALSAPGDYPPIEYRIKHADGSWRHFESAATNLSDDPEAGSIVVVTRDVTDRRRAERHRRARYEVERVASCSASLQEAAPGVLAGLCDALEWEAGELWVPDESSGKGVLKLLESRRAPATGSGESGDSGEPEDAGASGGRTSLEPGEGLPSRVLRSGSTLWVADAAQDESLPHGTGAGGRLAFPVPAADGTRGVVGVISLSSRSAKPPETETEAVAGSIGVHLGQAAERWRAYEALRGSEKRNSYILDAIPDIMFRVGRDGEVREYRAEESLLAARPEDVIGKRAQDMLDFAEISHPFMAQVARTLDAGEPQLDEYRLPAAAGLRDFEVRMLVSGPDEVFGIARDVTGYRRAEAKLKHQAAAMESSADGIGISDASGVFTYLNRAHADLYGYDDPDELVGKTWRDLYSEESIAWIEQKVFPALEAEGRWRGEATGVRKDGSEFPQELSLTSLEDGGTVCVFRDITERRQAEETLERERNLLRTVMDSTRDAIFSKDTRHRFRLSNAAHQRILNAGSESELIGKTNADYWQEAADPFHADDRRVLDAGESVVDREERIPGRSAGEEMWISTTKVPLRAPDGTVEGLVAVSRDITERRQEQDELALTATRLGSLIQNMPSGVLVEDENRKIRRANTAITRMFGMSAAPEELVGEDCGAAARSVAHLFADPEGFARGVEEIVASGRPVAGEEIPLADGRVYERDYVPLFVNGEYRGHMWQYHDLTEHKRMEQALRRSEERFRVVFEKTALGMAVTDLDRHFLDTNPAYQRLTGYTRQELSGMSVAELDHPDDAAHNAGDRRELISDERDRYQHEKRYVRKSGEVIWVRSSVTAVRDEDGSPRFLIGTIEDITERKRVQDALAESERLLRAVSRGAPIILFATDFEGVITLSEGKALELVGLRPGAAVGQRVFEAYAGFPGIVDSVRRALAGEEAAATVEAVGLTFESRYSPMWNAGGEITGMVGVATDITDRRRLEKELEHRAYHDPLTGLPNRELFRDRLDQALERKARWEQPLAILFLDLDDFKHVNDTLGHSAGDRLLVSASRRIRSCLRSEDTMARLGGDEFAVLLEDVPDPDFPARVARRISGELRRSAVPGDEAESEEREISTTTSVGIAVGEAGAAPGAEELLQRADAALYRAKETGKDHHESFRQEMQDRSAEVLRVDRELRLALERDEFVLHYQPKTALKTGKVVGVEALVRWEHPERGLVYPAEFISLAEDSGLIVPLGRQVLYEACRQASEWRAARPTGSGQEPLRVCVNLSARQLQSPDLLSDVSGALSKSGLDPAELMLEITETSLIKQGRRGASALGELKELGVKLAIDDFGSGYSSLSYLKDLPVDALKVDRSLVSGIGQDSAKAAIVSAALAVAHALGLPAIAEGVEGADELERLNGLGCDIGQGYYWSRPVPASEFARLL